MCRARSGARGAFQSPPASRVSLASLFPANPPPRSLACSFGGRRLIAIGAPGKSLRGSWRARRRCLPSDRSLPRRSRARGDRRVTFRAALPPGSPGLGSARRQPSRPRERVSVGRDCFVCPLFLRSGRRALADTSLSSASIHRPDTLSTVHRLQYIPPPPPPPPSGHPAHSSGAPHPLTDAQASPALRTHFWLSAHTAALRVHPSTASCTCTHNLTQPLHARARPRTPAFSHFFPPSLFFTPSNGSCRQGGPGSARREAPAKGSLPPAAGSTSGF